MTEPTIIENIKQQVGDLCEMFPDFDKEGRFMEIRWDDLKEIKNCSIVETPRTSITTLFGFQIKIITPHYSIESEKEIYDYPHHEKGRVTFTEPWFMDD